MFKHLVLMRHAKSDWSVTGQKDFDRELNPRGNRDAPRMGGRLTQEKGLKPDLVIASPAIRTSNTAKYVCEQLKFPEEKIVFDEEIYEGSVRSLLKVVNSLDDSCNTVLLVGHNPGISYLAEYITKQEIGELPTSGIVSIHFEFDSWSLISEGTGKLEWYIYPKDADEESE
ncbi:MAG: histidine phosphatase family protein [Phormidesmis sp. FL-bin-119]|nr:histidine phosphatase family protein [Pedobacter sp.]